MGQKYIPVSLGKKYIDASGCAAGRLASYVAKLALNGYEVYVVNSEKAIITGKPQWLKKYWYHKWWRSDWYKGPFYPRMPDRILKRIIRGMLPWHNWRGRIAYKRIKCYIGIPDELKNVKFEKPDFAKPKFKRGTIKYMTIEEISKYLGAKL